MQCLKRCLLLLAIANIVVCLPRLHTVYAASSDAVLSLAESAEKRSILFDILNSINQLEQELRDKQESLHSAEGETPEAEINKQIQQIQTRLQTLRENLKEIASGVDLKSVSQQKEPELDWQKSILDLLKPIIIELTRLTARPREIEELRTEITQYETKERLVAAGLQNIKTLVGQLKDPALAPHLRALEDEWKARKQETNTQLNIARQQLKQKLDQQPTLTESMKTILELFFRSRGRNLVMAVLAFASFWLFAHRLHGWLQNLRFLRGHRRSFSMRLFNVAYTVFSIVSATLSFLMVLYFSKDWVLLTLAVLFLLGIVWTSKTALGHFVNEVMLLLNLGTVREGERVLYMGVPWLVQSLNLFTHLVNPELIGGDVRLPIRDLHGLRSRAFEADEPWFPTRTGDWVLCQNDTLGQVVLQTPEIVRLMLLGGAIRVFNTTDFLAQSPTVLSLGFRLEETFGVDYQHQLYVTGHMRTILETKLRETLDSEGYGDFLGGLSVQFAEAGASALNLRVMADFAGEAAAEYLVLRRLIHRICVDTCNEQQWVIPFTQLTLHMASTASGTSPLVPDGVSPDPQLAPHEEQF